MPLVRCARRQGRFFGREERGNLCGSTFDIGPIGMQTSSELKNILPGMTKNAAAYPRFFLLVFLILLLLVAAARPLVATIEDPDFFWHLRTGGWIWEHKALPQEFLFSLTASETMNDAQRVTMTSYWLVQVLYHLLYTFGGLTAIALLRVALMALLVGTLIMRSPRRDILVFLGSAIMGVILMRIYPFERPQIFSFIFFSLLLLLLDRLIHPPPDAAWPRSALLTLPLLMIAWANCHGGFIVGQAVLVLYLVLEGFKFAHPSLGPIERNRYRLLLGAGTAGFLAAFVNPNTYHVFLAARLPAWMTAGNNEYQSTVSFFRTYNAPVIMVFWFLLALGLFGFVLAGKKPDITRLALLAGTGIFAFVQIRYLPFFMLSAVPVIEHLYSGGAPAKAGRVFLLAAASTAGLYLLPGDLESLKRYRGANVVSILSYPEDAAKFIMSRSAEGNLYNFWGWGGYLLWRLSPAKVFSDGRHFSYDVFEMNAAVEAGNRTSQAGEPPWRTIFRNYGIRYAVLPVFNPRVGNVMGLLFALGSSPDWAPVFIGFNSVVFVEKTDGNHWAAPLTFASRELFFDELVRRCEDLSRRVPNYPFPHIARGDLLLWLRRHDDARAAYQSALRLVPLNQLARSRLAAVPAAGRRATR